MFNCFICVLLFAIHWTIDQQVPLSMGFFRQEYWSGLSHPPSEDLPNPGIEPKDPMSLAFEGRFFTSDMSFLTFKII